MTQDTLEHTGLIVTLHGKEDEMDKCPVCGYGFICSSVEPKSNGVIVHRWCGKDSCNWNDVVFIEEVSDDDTEAKD